MTATAHPRRPEEPAVTSTQTATLTDGRWTVRPEDAVTSFSVRKLGLIRVRGGFTVADGSVTVTDGRPVAATASLDAASVRTGNAKRDKDLAGRRFFRAAEHPRIGLRCDTVVPDGDGWRAAAVLTVAGGDAPLELQVVRLPDPSPGVVRVRATGVLDRAATPLRAPRWLIGRQVSISVDATLRLTG
jgi:polyisoprenoid-binding protein YceI